MSTPTPGVGSPNARRLLPYESLAELVTIVIPARNEEAALGECLDSILRQDYPNLQVIVVDGASIDRTPEVIKAYQEQDARVEVINNPDSIIPKSLNLALAAARGRWLVRVDAHATIPRDYVGRAAEHLRTGHWGGVGGRKVGVGVTVAGMAIAAAMSSRFGVGNSTYHYGDRQQTVDHIPFGAYTTDVVRTLGGWNEELRVNQDFEFDFRLRAAGHQLLFDPQLAIDWTCRQSLADLFKQYRRYGKGKSIVAMLHPASLEPRHLAAPSLVLCWFAALPLSFRRSRLTAAATLPYIAALTVASLSTASRVPGFSARIRVPGAFLTMHTAWGLGFWEGMLTTGTRTLGRSLSDRLKRRSS